jgi:hypothetical protein
MSKYLLVAALACAIPIAAFAEPLIVHTSELKEPGIHDDNAESYACIPKEPAAGPLLLVFLPGTGSSVSGYTNFMQFAADRGYYVIGLAYRNDKNHSDLCGCMKWCMGKMEEQNAIGVDNGFYGGDAKKGMTPKLNSVDHRLTSLLTFLKDEKIDGKSFDWTQFIDKGKPRWKKIVISGHSGGGNLAT